MQYKIDEKFVIFRCLHFNGFREILSEREYLSSEISVSTNSPKILDITKKNIFQLNLIH